MKFLLFLIFSISSFSSQTPGIQEVRTLYLLAAEEEDQAEALLDLTDASDQNEPIYLGYEAAGHMMMAKHVGNPFSKMSHFKKGKEKLGDAITAAPENVELRFLRFSVQAEAPGFLGYQDNLEEDKALLLSRTPEIEDMQLKKMILDYLKNSNGLTTEEKVEL